MAIDLVFQASHLHVKYYKDTVWIMFMNKCSSPKFVNHHIFDLARQCSDGVKKITLEMN